jgi:hypothetical protein
MVRVHSGLPFQVAAPFSTCDFHCNSRDSKCSSAARFAASCASGCDRKCNKVKQTTRYLTDSRASRGCGKIESLWPSQSKNASLRRRKPRNAISRTAPRFRRIWIRSKKLPKNRFPPAIRRPGFPSRQNRSENRNHKMRENRGAGNLPNLAPRFAAEKLN